jgi:hypothetical protein
VRAAAAVTSTAGRVEDRFIVNLAVYAVLGTADRPPNVNDARESLRRQYLKRQGCLECITVPHIFPGPG